MHLSWVYEIELICYFNLGKLVGITGNQLDVNKSTGNGLRPWLEPASIASPAHLIKPVSILESS